MIGCEMGRGEELHLRVRVCSSFWIAKYLNLPPQESFDHPKGGYVRDLWEDVFSSCEGSTGKLLAGHLLRDDSRLGEDVSRQ